jgi:hypothetical protein
VPPVAGGYAPGVSSPSALRPYAWLCGSVGTLMVVAGLLLFVSFIGYHAPNSDPRIPTGPVGFYFVAFSGCALLGWGGSLLATARQPGAGRGIGTATAFALVLSAVYRMLGWVVGDYYAFAGELLRVEAGIFLLLALAFLWLRPARETVTA